MNHSSSTRPSPLSTIFQSLNPWLSLGGVLAIIAVLRLPSLWEPSYYSDEGITMTLGLGVRKGLLLYRDLQDNKPPLLYWLAAMFGSSHSMRAFLLIWLLMHSIVLWVLARTFKVSAFFSSFLVLGFGVLASIPLLEGMIVNGEIFMILPATTAVLLVWKGWQNSLQKLFWAGIFFALAFLFKVPAAFELLAVLGWLGILALKQPKSSPLSRVIKRGSVLILGFSLPIVLVFGYFWMQGALDDYVRSVFARNVPYALSWGGDVARPFWQSGLLVRALVITGFGAILIYFRKRLPASGMLVVCWFLGSLFGSLLSQRPYPHYLLQTLPPTILLIGMLRIHRGGIYRFLACLALALLPFSYRYYQFWYYPSWPYYRNALQYITNRQTTTAYWNYFSPAVSINYQIVEYTKAKTHPSDTLYIWGNEPFIYVLSDRLPATRYTTDYHVSEFQAWDEVIQTLKISPPAIIVEIKPLADFPQLQELVQQDYQLVKKLSGTAVYQKIPSTTLLQ